MTTVESLLAEIEAFLAEADMKPTRFGKLVLNDGDFIRRLRNGSGVTVATVERVRSFMASERANIAPPEPAGEQGAAGGASVPTATAEGS